MNDQKNIEFDELLNAIIDDEATERQKTEFKRLVKHDPSLEVRLESLRRQKELVNALPIEAAPQGCVETVTSLLERKFILNDFSDSEPASTVSGSSHLLLRRVLTTAAMLLLPLGLLSLVVWQIIKPASEGPVDYISTDRMLAQNDPGDSPPIRPMLVQQLPFDGILTFRTNQQMTISNYVEKVVFDLGLISATVPSRNVDVTTYQVTASPVQVAALLGSLQNVWPHCKQVDLSIVDGAENNTIDIDNVQAQQVKALVMEDSAEVLNQMAVQFAKTNRNKDTAYASTEGRPAADDPPTLPKPILTGRDDAPKPVPPAQSTVRLRIHIKRTVQ